MITTMTGKELAEYADVGQLWEIRKTRSLRIGGVADYFYVIAGESCRAFQLFTQFVPKNDAHFEFSTLTIRPVSCEDIYSSANSDDWKARIRVITEGTNEVEVA